ncbi:MAG: tRNA (adenosine(37)-N6)-threonylcarbamoyltransferase complex dimerization subunit type 1 TsaB [Hyphomicrobiaceae bacterium]
MIILSFDTCFQACSVAVGSALSAREIQSKLTPLASCYEPRQRGHAEAIVPLIEQVLHEGDVAASQVDAIAVTHGPGSFTGTRINVAAARALGLALDAPIHATTSLRVMGQTAARKLDHESRSVRDGNRAIVVTVDARREAVYTLVCSPQGVGEDENVQLLSIDDAAQLASQDGAIFVGSGARTVCDRIKQVGLPESFAHLPDLQPDALDLWHMAARGQVGLVDPVMPLYLRPADAKPQIGKSIERIKSN